MPKLDLLDRTLILACVPVFFVDDSEDLFVLDAQQSGTEFGVGNVGVEACSFELVKLVESQLECCLCLILFTARKLSPSLEQVVIFMLLLNAFYLFVLLFAPVIAVKRVKKRATFD